MALIITLLFLTTVDLEPKITPDFFFSQNSEIYKKDQEIKREFPFQQQLLLNVKAANTITEPDYIQKISGLSTRLQQVQGVEDLQSITHGPEDLEDARENPLWSRLLIGNKEQSSFIVLFVDTEDFSPLVQRIENIVKEEVSGKVHHGL